MIRLFKHGHLHYLSPTYAGVQQSNLLATVSFYEAACGSRNTTKVPLCSPATRPRWHEAQSPCQPPEEGRTPLLNADERREMSCPLCCYSRPPPQQKSPCLILKKNQFNNILTPGLLCHIQIFPHTYVLASFPQGQSSPSVSHFIPELTSWIKKKKDLFSIRKNTNLFCRKLLYIITQFLKNRPVNLRLNFNIQRNTKSSSTISTHTQRFRKVILTSNL